MSKIIAALGQLDVGNDAHWTSDGLPRIDTVKFLVGDQSLTREDINKAAPGFSRANTALPGVQPDQAAQGAAGGGSTDTGSIAPPAADTQAGPADNGGSNGEVHQEAAEGAGQSEPLTERAALEAELAVAQAELDEIEQAFVRAETIRSKAREKRDRILVAIDRLPAEPSTAPFLGYLASQARQLETRAAQRRALNESGVNLKDLMAITGASPLDVAMARKTGYGTKRPGAK
jgi:hypothetical protein